MIPEYQVCPGCGVHLPGVDQTYDSRCNASAACWLLYGELSAYTLAQGYGLFIHQLAVDTYGAQHVGESSPPIGAAFALIGLYLACERGYSGRQVQHMHMLLANRSKSWPRFTPPCHAFSPTVQDVMRAEVGEDRDAVLRQWARATWDAWEPDHARVAALITHVMGD